MALWYNRGIGGGFVRKVYVEFPRHLPARVTFEEIMSIPFQWKNALTILWVLEGSLSLTVESERYEVSQNEVEIINEDEVYAIQGQGPNKVLVVEVDPTFFARYYEDAATVFFYTNAPGDRMDDWRYVYLRELLARLSFEAIQQMDDFDEQMENLLLKLMYHLLNHFHYLYYELDSLKEDEEQLARYHRILKYMSHNYRKQIRLSDLAGAEYLSENYLSSKIKELTGQSFKEYLNQIRVEESTKLLLDSDLFIGRIAEAVGFSHVRYYNQHFKRHYHMTPREYRKAYRLTDEEVKTMTVIRALPWEEAMDAMEGQLRGWDRYYATDEMTRLDLTVRQDSLGPFPKPEVIDMGEASLWLEEENRQLFIAMQKRIHFRYGLISRLFSADMDIYRGKNRRFHNWTRVEAILEFFAAEKLIPIIDTTAVEASILEDFVENFSNVYGEKTVRSWLTVPEKGKLPLFLPVIPHPLYDRLEAVSWIFAEVQQGRMYRWQAVDMITEDLELTNETFFGGPGLVTANFLYKPLYFAMTFLALMGDEILAQGDGYWLTASEHGYELLVFNDAGVQWTEDDFQSGIRQQKKWVVNLQGLQGDYYVTRFTMGEEDASIYDRWESLGCPERLDYSTWERFLTFVHPSMNVMKVEKAPLYHLVFTLKAFGAALFLLTPAD